MMLSRPATTVRLRVDSVMTRLYPPRWAMLRRMDVPRGFDPTLILVLNLAGTFVFGLSGGLAAVRAKLDLFGVVVLAAVVGLAGGITRDVLIGTAPATFRDWRYLAAAAVDPVVLAAMIVVRLQTVVAREIAPTEPAVLTVGSIQAGTKSNVISDHAVLQLNVRSYSDQTRDTILDAIKRIVNAECQASGSPQEPQFELFDRFPPTLNDPAT